MGLGPATEDEMREAVAQDWAFTALANLLTGRGVRFYTAVGHEYGHALHVLGVPFLLAADVRVSPLSHADSATVTGPRMSVVFMGSSKSASRWYIGDEQTRREEVATTLADLRNGKSSILMSAALSWKPERIAEGGSLLQACLRLTLDRWWDERMEAGYSHQDAEVMLGLLLHPATAALVSFPDNDAHGHPQVRFPDDPDDAPAVLSRLRPQNP